MRVEHAPSVGGSIGASLSPGAQLSTGEGSRLMSDEDTGLIVVSSEQSLRDMAAHLLSDERYQPVIALTESVDAPMLAYELVRAVVGAGPRIYLIDGGFLLACLADLLGHELALSADSARIWWPGLAVGSDPGDHPLVVYLDGEPDSSMLEEFARQFDLSRPLVRREIKLIEDARALAEHELAHAREENRNMKIERHDALSRAELAEARLRAVVRRLEPGEHDEPGGQ
jgi:hypothetical protein